MLLYATSSLFEGFHQEDGVGESAGHGPAEEARAAGAIFRRETQSHQRGKTGKDTSNKAAVN